MAGRSFSACGLMLVVALAIAELPGYSWACGRHNPNLNKCAEDTVTNLRSSLKNGIPELGVPPLDNILINEVPLVDIKDFSAVAHRVRLSGLSGFQLKYITVDLRKQTIDFEVLLPKVQLDSDNINVKAKILVPVVENGPLTGYAENINAKLHMKFEKLVRKGRTLIYFPTIMCKLTVKDYVATFRPANPDETPVIQAINSVVHTNRQEIVASLVPSLENAIGQKVLEVANQICKRYTYDELFPDRT